MATGKYGRDHTPEGGMEGTGEAGAINCHLTDPGEILNRGKQETW